MSARHLARWSWLVAAIVVTGCAADEGSPPTATAPPELAECADPADAADEAACLDQIEGFIESHIGGFDDAIERVTGVLSTASTASFEFERVTPTGEGYNPAEPGDAIEMQWRMGSTDRTMFACAAGVTFEVGTDPCPD